MDEPPLHELGSIVVEAFDKLLDIEQNNEWLKAEGLTSESERFQLWAQNLGLFQEGHASLDYRVRDAVFVRDRLAELLRELAEHIRELYLILLGEKTPAEQLDIPVEDDSSSSESSSESSVRSRISCGSDSFHEIDFRFQSLTERLDSLYSLAARIRNPKNRPSHTVNHLYKHIPESERLAYIRNREELEANIVSYILRQHIIEISNRDEIQSFHGIHGVTSEDTLSEYTSPNCWIIRRTGKANARRKQQLAYWKDHALRLSQVKKRPTNSAEPTPVERNVTPIRHISPSNLNGSKPAALSLATSASKLPVLKPDDIKSVISHQSRVSTIISVRHNDLYWPPPPERPAHNRYFECPYCRTFCPVKYLENDAWETHLIHDLQAYHCTYERCQDPNRLYGSKQEWLDHESQHNKVWICQEHDEEFETNPDYMDHLQTKHPEFQADRLSEVLIGTAVGTSKKIHRSCPFCPTGFNEIIEMQRHIAFHLVRLALLALSPGGNGTNNDDDSIKSSDSHQPHQSGRTKSMIGDFGFKHGLQRIPCDRLKMGSLSFANTSNQMLGFYDRGRGTFSFCFRFSDQDDQTLLSETFLKTHNIRQSNCEYIIEYPIEQLLDFMPDRKVERFYIGFDLPPLFYIRQLTGMDRAAIKSEDFTKAPQFPHVLEHLIRLSSTVNREDFDQLVGSILDNDMTLYKETRAPELNSTEWSKAIQAIKTTQANNDVRQWILDVDPNSYPSDNLEQIDPPEDVDKDIIQAESLSWRSESEYYTADDSNKALRAPPKIIPNPDCAICHAPIDLGCKCETDYFNSTVQAAEM
ncbi:hypothetical protein F4859DRAFT_512978 [Xylaria cf. heliscus]|nr:hypothetical protein F4859DRAFT_512978 [Xylaria cf. heliscus]